jgi:translation initiation factor IF-3
VRYNRGIRAQTVRLIDSKGEQLGVVAIQDALKRAETEGLDLVEVAPEAKPPVCRVMDYGKFLYQESKREKEAKKNQKVVNVKEVKFTPTIQQHDYQTKLRNCFRFLEGGDKVKVTMFFRGREQSHTELGEIVLKRLAVDLEEYGFLEKDHGLENRVITRIFAPHPHSSKKTKKESHAETKDKQDDQKTV